MRPSRANPRTGQLKRQRSHRRHRCRNADRKTRTARSAVRRWLRALDRMGVPLEILFGPLVLWCGPGR